MSYFCLPSFFIIKISFICLISPPLLYYLHYHLYYFHFGLSSYQLMTFRPLFTNYNFVLKYCTIFGFLNFHFLHLIYEKFNLCLQNTLNMSKTTKVYFGALHVLGGKPDYANAPLSELFARACVDRPEVLDGKPSYANSPLPEFFARAKCPPFLAPFGVAVVKVYG